MSNIEIVELSRITEKKRTAITGFAGAGFIGNTALMHAVRTGNLRQVAYLHSEVIPPVMVLVDGKPRHGFRVYTDPADELIFLVADSMISGESAWIIGKELMAWLKKKGLKEIISFEGFPFSQTAGNIFGFTTGRKNLQEYNIQPLAQGAISGVNASLLKETLKDDTPWTTVFVPTRIVSGVDYEGAASAIRLLNRMFNLAIDTEQLEKIAEAVTRAARTQQPARQQKRGGFLDRILPGQTDL